MKLVTNGIDHMLANKCLEYSLKTSDQKANPKECSQRKTSKEIKNSTLKTPFSNMFQLNMY